MSIEYPCVHWENGMCKYFSDDEVKSYCVEGPCDASTPSNGDHIRSMTDEELADFLEGEFGNMVTGTALGWLKEPKEDV